MALDALALQFDAFLAEAHRLKEQYTSDITLFVGLETEFITEGDLTGLETLLSKHGQRIEYLVGSVHHANTIPIDFDSATFEKALDSFPASQTVGEEGRHQRTEALLCSYFDAQYDLLTRFHPEIVGHIDLCRLYTPTLRFRDYPVVWDKLERNVRYAIDYGALFELNAAALGKGWDASYPGEDVAKASTLRRICVLSLKLYVTNSSSCSMVDVSPCQMTATAHTQSVSITIGWPSMSSDWE